MIRTIIGLPPDEKRWLSKIAKLRKVSMAYVIRESIAEYHKNHAEEATTSVDRLLAKTRGIWSKGDGLDYQCSMRDEWEK